MPNKLTDSEIVKALECCACETIMYCEDQCPFYEKCMKDEQLSKYALDLINRQKAEVDDLKTENLILSQKRFNIFERLEFTDKLKKQIKAEAYKEFAERLKEKFARQVSKGYCKVLNDFVDNLLKELEGDNNES